MLYRKIGLADLNASVIALGTWVMGGWMWGGSDEMESIAAVHASIDHGVNLIDTAPIYGFGKSEEVIGKAIKDRRDKVILATKCGLVWWEEKGDFFFYTDDSGKIQNDSKMKVYKYLNPKSIEKEIEASLRRLQTDYIDLYQTHKQDSTTPIDDTMAMLLKLKDQGKIRAIGVSSATTDQMKQYGVIASDQEKFNMLERDIEKNGNTFYCNDNQMALLAYSSLAQGLLTGKISPDYKFGKGDVRIENPLFEKSNIDKVNSMLKEFNPIAEKYNITLAQLVLAWTFKQYGITHLLCGARNAKQAVENAEAGNIDLHYTDINKIDEIYSNYFE